MPEFSIVRDDERAASTGGRDVYTIIIDGVPSLKWFPACETPGMKPDYFAQRCIDRLKAGRSNVFGGPLIVADTKVVGRAVVAGQAPVRARVYRGEPKTETVESGGKKGKTRERVVTPWVAELDGATIGEFATEAEAKCATACQAWKTAGKLGQIPAALAALQEAFPGKACEVKACPKKHRIVASVDGVRYHVGFRDDGGFKFVPCAEAK